MNNEERILSMLTAMDQKMDQLTTDVSGLKQDVAVLKQDVAVLKQDVAVLKQDMAEAKQDIADLKVEVAVLKEDVAGLKQEVADLKQDVAVLKEDVADLKADVARIDLTLENEVDRKIGLLMEGHQSILEKLIPVSRVEQLEDDVTVLKAAFRVHDSQISKLLSA